MTWQSGNLLTQKGKMVLLVDLQSVSRAKARQNFNPKNPSYLCIATARAIAPVFAGEESPDSTEQPTG